jgi:hypothetical protein
MESMGSTELQLAFDRVVRLFRLDLSVLDQVRDDASATVPSVVTAAAAMFLAGLGAFLWSAVEFEFDGEFFWKSALLGTVFAMALWFVWVGVTYSLITQVMKGHTDIQRLVRAMGLATAPMALSILMFIPEVSFGIGLVAAAMTFSVTSLAVVGSADLPPGKSFAANAAGFAVWALVLPIIISSDNPFGPGVFAFDWAGDVVNRIYDAVVVFG